MHSCANQLRLLCSSPPGCMSRTCCAASSCSCMSANTSSTSSTPPAGCEPSHGWRHKPCQLDQVISQRLQQTRWHTHSWCTSAVMHSQHCRLHRSFTTGTPSNGGHPLPSLPAPPRALTAPLAPFQCTSQQTRALARTRGHGCLHFFPRQRVDGIAEIVQPQVAVLVGVGGGEHLAPHARPVGRRSARQGDDAVVRVGGPAASVAQPGLRPGWVAGAGRLAGA